ncbi:EVE domain-containing protein [Spirosoma fluviale]|uniref:Predicted RNA-binding protein, contains PUA-like domain n=1 Tax=Spirosoma fluviale TaxID=1597977 RepID=A0A286FFZ5_9BACT|nr:EVE domain-containing protein [Spirosoma fluviale]SOD82165.1 Predicted RNA-binding protein, contains PUA-like domain [Spirosoma fluviale]
MNYWLVKSEPDTYGWHHFIAQGRATWDGVRNYQARNNLKSMTIGDQVLFYHSVTNPAVVGLATVVREYFQDPTVPDDARWVAVELEPVMSFEKTVTLAQIKAEPMLSTISLIKQSRLSVMPVRTDEFELILKLGQTTSEALSISAEE